MGLMQYHPCRYRGLMAALGALISPVGQSVSMTATAFGANIPGLPDPFPHFPVSWHYSIMRYVA